MSYNRNDDGMPIIPDSELMPSHFFGFDQPVNEQRVREQCDPVSFKPGAMTYRTIDDAILAPSMKIIEELTQHVPTDDKERKRIPLATGVIDYFPDALLEVAKLSQVGNDKHNPGQPLHWSRNLSNDHPDCLMRHFVDRGKKDTNGIKHSAEVAWRALAILQLEIEAERS